MGIKVWLVVAATALGFWWIGAHSGPTQSASATTPNDYVTTRQYQQDQQQALRQQDQQQYQQQLRQQEQWQQQQNQLDQQRERQLLGG